MEKQCEITIKGRKFKVKYDEETKTIKDQTEDDEIDQTLLEVDPNNQSELNRIFNEVHDELKKQLKAGAKQTLLNILGFDKGSWSSDVWKIDHCNGRMSEMGNYIKRSLEEVISDLSINVPAITQEDADNLGKAMKNEYMDMYKKQYRNVLNELAMEKAENDAKEFFKELTTNDDKLVDQVLEQIFKKSSGGDYGYGQGQRKQDRW